MIPRINKWAAAGTIALLISGSGFVGLGLGSSLRQAAAKPQAPLQYKVNVTLKLIQVVVMDRDGNPVTDLKKEDFVLTDNGRRMTLTEFEKHALSVPVVERPAEERIVPTAIPEKSALLNRKIFFFFNFGYSSMRGVRRAREEALKFLETSVLPSDEVAVMSYSLFDRLKVLEFLTADHAKVRKALESVGIADALGAVEDPDIRDARLHGLFDMTGARTSQDPEHGQRRIQPAEDVYAFQQARLFISYLTSFAQAMRYLPGQKILVFFTMGIDGRILYRGDPIGDQFAEVRKGYEYLCSELATSNVAVYPIDTTDKDTGEFLLPEAVRGVSSLRRMAGVTGGEYMGHVDASVTHFEKIQKLTGAYYVLGYQVPETWDGKFHKIKVEVGRRGCEVRAQSGYLDPKPFSDYTKIERELHLVDLALSERPLGQVPLRFPLAAIPAGWGGDGGIWLIAGLPVRDVREKWTGGPVEILGLVYDRNDEIISVTRSEERLSAIKENSVFLAAWESVPPGAYRCRIVIRDLETGAAAVGGTTISIPEISPDIRLLQPLFLRSAQNARYISQGAPRGMGKNAGMGAVSTTLGYDPALYVPSLESKFAKGSENWAVVPCACPEGSKGKIKLTAKLLDKATLDEIPVALSVLGITERNGVAVYFVRFAIPEVEPDEYRFGIIAEGVGQPFAFVEDVIIE